MPCSEQDTTIHREIELDSNSYIREIEVFDEQQNIVSSCSPNEFHNKNRKKEYYYDQNILSYVFEEIDDKTIKIINYDYFTDGVKMETHIYKGTKQTAKYLTESEYKGGYKFETTNQVWGRDTVLRGQTIFDSNGLPVHIVGFHGNERYSTILERNENGQITYMTSVSPRGHVENREYRPIKFEKEVINLNSIELREGIDKLYLEQYDEHGNIIRQFILNNNGKCLAIWYYKIELQNN